MGQERTSRIGSSSLGRSAALQSAGIDPQTVCATVLAGGRAQRMGGIDKGLQDFQGQPLAWHALQRLKAQTLGTPGLMAVNANRNLSTYAAWGHPVWADTLADFAGPLAGFQTALQHCQLQARRYDYLLVVPCDSPLFPLDLLDRLAHALLISQAQIAVAAITEVDRHGLMALRAQPVFCLLQTSLTPRLHDFLEAGGRKIGSWMAQQHTVEVAFDRPGDDPRDFSNANTLEQLQQLHPPHPCFNSRP